MTDPKTCKHVNGGNIVAGGGLFNRVVCVDCGAPIKGKYKLPDGFIPRPRGRRSNAVLKPALADQDMRDLLLSAAVVVAYIDDPIEPSPLAAIHYEQYVQKKRAIDRFKNAVATLKERGVL